MSVEPKPQETARRVQAQALILTTLRRGGTVRSAVKLAAVPLVTYVKWRERDPVFNAAALAAIAEGREVISP